MSREDPTRPRQPVVSSEARDLTLTLSSTNQRRIPLRRLTDRNDSGRPLIAILPLLLAVILACSLACLGQESPDRGTAVQAAPAGGSPAPPENPPQVNLDDEGVFDISLAGNPVGTESFRIHSSLGKIEAQAEIRLHVVQNGKTISSQSFPSLVMDPQLHPVTYTWNQKGSKSSRLEVDFRGKFAKVRYKTINGSEDDRDFQLPPDVAVLDDNVFHHYQLIVARYVAMGGGKQTFPVFVPQEALPSLLTVEDMGNSASTTGGALSNLRHLLITTDVTQIVLWVNNLQHLERVAVPSAQLEAIRKK